MKIAIVVVACAVVASVAFRSQRDDADAAAPCSPGDESCGHAHSHCDAGDTACEEQFVHSQRARHHQHHQPEVLHQYGDPSAAAGGGGGGGDTASAAGGGGAEADRDTDAAGAAEVDGAATAASNDDPAAAAAAAAAASNADQDMRPGELENVAFIVLTERVEPHMTRFKHMQATWKFDTTTDKSRLIPSWSLHRAGWALIPLFIGIDDATFSSQVEWVGIVSDDAEVRGAQLARTLEEFDPTQHLFLGRALQDSWHAIIHHYSGDFDFRYPDVSSGVLLSMPLVRKLAAAVRSETREAMQNFTIDPSYELARYVQSRAGVNLTDVSSLCAGGAVLKADGSPFAPYTNPSLFSSRYYKAAPSSDSTTTAASTTSSTSSSSSSSSSTPNNTSTPSSPSSSFSSCAIISRGISAIAKPLRALTANDIFVAVKTVSKYHATRLATFIQGWGKHVPLIKYFSDIEDLSIPTLVSPNSESGHCAKLWHIVKYAKENHADKPWLLVVDDDTKVSFKFLSMICVYVFVFVLVVCFGRKKGVGQRKPLQEYNRFKDAMRDSVSQNSRYLSQLNMRHLLDLLSLYDPETSILLGEKVFQKSIFVL